jgi:hypothetical protein
MMHAGPRPSTISRSSPGPDFPTGLVSQEGIDKEAYGIRCAHAFMVLTCLVRSTGGGGSGGSGAPGPRAGSTYTVGGTVSGRVGNLTRQNNGGDNLTITGNGPFTFGTGVASGATCHVTVLTQPSGLPWSVRAGRVRWPVAMSAPSRLQYAQSGAREPKHG